MRTKNTIAIILVVLVLTSIAIFPIQTVKATPFFTDGYETGDFSNWQGTSDDSGSQMTISTTTVFAGSYSADCSLSSTIGTYAYVYKSFSAIPVLYHREYIRVSSLPPSDAETDLFGIMDVIATGTNLGTIGIQNDGSNYRWQIKYYNNGIDEVAYSTDVAIKANTWYYIEIMVKSGVLGTGQVDVWIAEDLTTINQSSPTITLTNLTNAALPIGTAFFGGYVTGASYPVHIYSDSVALSDTWIGPEISQAQQSAPYQQPHIQSVLPLP